MARHMCAGTQPSGMPHLIFDDQLLRERWQHPLHQRRLHVRSSRRARGNCTILGNIVDVCGQQRSVISCRTTGRQHLYA